MNESEEILTIVFSIIGFISLIIIISLSIWCCCFRSKKTSPKKYQRSQKLSTTKNVIHTKRKQRTKRFNTNDSTISFSFNPPHLINQNVKNLDQLIGTEPSVYYENKILTNDYDRCYKNSPIEPIYTSSSSSISTPRPNLTPVVYSQNSQQLNNLHFHFLNELNRVLCLKREQQSTSTLKYSQSCRQTTDLLPFDYYRSITPSISLNSSENICDPIYYRTTMYNGSNATLIHKAHLAQLRDDTAILY